MVLARYNTVGKTTAFFIAIGAVFLPLGSIPFLLGGVDDHIYAIYFIVPWVCLLPGAPAAMRAVSNILFRESRAVYVDEGVLHYDAPGMIGSLRLSPSDILHARPTMRKRFAATPSREAKVKPVLVVEVGRARGKPRDIAVYALDVFPETLAAAIGDFAAGKSPAGATQAIVQ